MPDPIIYVFGYGSLMYASGINGRGMQHVYNNHELTPATLKGYKRGVYAIFDDRGYYSCIKKENELIYGILVPIYSQYDYHALMVNEGATEVYRFTDSGKMYDIMDVTNSVDIDLELNVPVVTLVHPNYKSIVDHTIDDWYKYNVNNGIKWLPKEFQDKFFETGGVT